MCGHADGLNNSSRSYKVESILAAERVWEWWVEKNKGVGPESETPVSSVVNVAVGVSWGLVILYMKSVAPIFPISVLYVKELGCPKKVSLPVTSRTKDFNK